MYPGMEMKLQVYAREAPDFRFKSGTITTDLLGAIEAFGVKADGALIPLFVLNVVGVLSLNKGKHVILLQYVGITVLE